MNSETGECNVLGLGESRSATADASADSRHDAFGRILGVVAPNHSGICSCPRDGEFV
jgi:hypothetical protein